MLRRLFIPLSVGVLLALGAGCSRRSSGDGSSPGSAAGRKKFYWVQAVKGVPVSQLTQMGFREGCTKLGYNSEVVGTNGPDIAGTVALAEQALAKGDAAGMAVWAGTPAFNLLIEQAVKMHVPVILPHFPVPEGSIPGASGVISCDPAVYAKTAALRIGELIHGQGTVAITQGSYNTTENMVAAVFTQTMHASFPQVKVLAPQEEGFEPARAITRAVSILEAHPDVIAALSTTGGGPSTWANAQRETGRKIIIIGMDYTRQNLDLVQKGDVYAIIAQPLWAESYGSAVLLDKLVHHKPIPWWTKLPAPLVTKDKLAPYYALINKVEATVNKQ